MTMEDDMLNMIGQFFILLLIRLKHVLTANKIKIFKRGNTLFFPKDDDMSVLLASMYWTFTVNKKFFRMNHSVSLFITRHSQLRKRSMHNIVSIYYLDRIYKTLH